MNRIYRCIIITLSLISFAGHANAPYVSIRSQSVDSSRDIVGLTDKINLFDMENLYIVGAVTMEGTRSFDSDIIANRMFGPVNLSLQSSDEVFVNVTGSQVPNRGATDWLADYFGLSTTFQSKLFFKPRISNFLIDFEFYVGLDEWVNGLYFWAHAPIVVSRWNLNFHEEVNNTLPLLGYPAGYFAPAAVPVSALVSDASDFLSDQDVPTLPGGVTFEPLNYARLEQARLHKTALAEIQMALGYNFILCEDYYLGLNFRVYAPTGNRPKGQFAFEAIVGNGKHWEVGAGFMGHYMFWRSCDEESSVGFYTIGNFTHLCRTHQTRTFDLKGKPNSRYMLAEKLGAPNNPPNLFANPTQGTAASSTVPSAQFKSAYAPVANLTTLNVNVSAAVQVDITALINYSSCGLSFDLGYNFWARSCEKISLRNDQGPTRLESGNVWALKGDANVFGFVASNAVTNPPTPNSPIALSATESLATINSGTNVALGGSQNPGIDNPEFAMFSTADNSDQLTILPGQPADLSQTNAAHTQQRTSNDPIFLSNANIDLGGARTKGLSNKIFAHLSYTWCECEDLMPYLGVGGKAEFGPRQVEKVCNPNNASCIIAVTQPLIPCDDCTGCQRTNLSEWGVWIKGGVFWS